MTTDDKTTVKPPFSGKRVRLGDLCEICSGGTPKRSEQEYWSDGTIPWIKISDIKGKYIRETEEFITESGLRNSSAKLLEPGTLILSIFASVGSVGILDISATTNQAIAGLKIKYPNISKDYLFYWLEAQESTFKSASRGVAQNNINLSILRNMEVPIPEFSQQEEVVRVLEAISSLKEAAINQLSALDSLVKSRFNEMFGDQKRASSSIRNIAKTCSGGTPSSKNPDYYDGGTIPWLTSGEVNQDRILSTSKCITEAGLRDSSAKWIPENSVVIAMYGATAGKSGLLKIPCTTNQAVCSILPTPHLNPLFLLHAIRSKEDWMVSQAAGGAQPNISQTIINRMHIPVASKSEQEQFADFVSQVDKLRFKVQQQIDRLEQLKKSLMQEYFG